MFEANTHWHCSADNTAKLTFRPSSAIDLRKLTSLSRANKQTNNRQNVMPQLVSIATSHSLLWRRRHTHTHTCSRKFIHLHHTNTDAYVSVCATVPHSPGHPSWKFAIETETKTKIIIQVWIQGKKTKKQRLFIIVEENYWKSYTLKIKHKKPVEKLCFICFHPT